MVLDNWKMLMDMYILTIETTEVIVWLIHKSTDCGDNMLTDYVESVCQPKWIENSSFSVCGWSVLRTFPGRQLLSSQLSHIIHPT